MPCIEYAGSSLCLRNWHNTTQNSSHLDSPSGWVQTTHTRHITSIFYLSCIHLWTRNLSYSGLDIQWGSLAWQQWDGEPRARGGCVTTEYSTRGECRCLCLSGSLGSIQRCCCTGAGCLWWVLCSTTVLLHTVILHMCQFMHTHLHVHVHVHCKVHVHVILQSYMYMYLTM